MAIFLYQKNLPPSLYPTAQLIQKLLKGYEIVAEPILANYLHIPSFSPSLHTLEAVFSLGGDGTILSCLHEYPFLSVPLLGINLGHLGFMADVPLQDLEASLQDFIEGKYSIDKRLVLQGEKRDTPPLFALNDFVIHRGQNPSLVEISIQVGGVYLNTFEADGIIIATPNGSTAYSLAAGGPILSPGLEAIVITPISPHTISNRPIVLTAKEQIQIEYRSKNGSVSLSADGLSSICMQPFETFLVSKHPEFFQLIKLHRRDYFSTLRRKLNWSGKLR